jgi:hypothetical protein
MGHQTASVEGDAPLPASLVAETFVPSAAALATARRVVPGFLLRLRALLQLCIDAPLWRLYASSLLFAYESDADAAIASTTAASASNGATVLTASSRADVTVIDFAHAYPISQAVPVAAAQLATELHRQHRLQHFGHDELHCTKHGEAVTQNAGASTCSCNRPTAIPDHNYVHGLRTLIGLFEGMLQTAMRTADEE